MLGTGEGVAQLEDARVLARVSAKVTVGDDAVFDVLVSELVGGAPLGAVEPLQLTLFALARDTQPQIPRLVTRLASDKSISEAKSK